MKRNGQALSSSGWSQFWQKSFVLSFRPSASIGDLPCTGRNGSPCLRGEHVFGRARRQSDPSQEKREKSKPVQAHYVESQIMFFGVTIQVSAPEKIRCVSARKVIFY
jgi:hypothetical protein